MEPARDLAAKHRSKRGILFGRNDPSPECGGKFAMIETLLQIIADAAVGTNNECRVQLLLAGGIGADRGNMGAGPDPGIADQGFA